MRQITGPILLLFLVLNGCNNQNHVATGSASAKTLTQNEIDEKHAANFLASSKDFQDDGHPQKAIKTLNELLEQFPDSESAVHAKKMLAELEKTNSKSESEFKNPKSGARLTVRGLLKHFPQDVKSTEAWLGHEFMIDETPIRTTKEVTREALIKMVGKNVEVEGRWNAGKKWEPPKPDEEEFQSQAPSYPTGVTVIRGSGIDASTLAKIEK